MTNTMRYLPWGLSAVLAIIFVLSWHNSKESLAQKDAELIALKQQYEQLATESTNKIAEANSKFRQLSEDANAKIRQLAEEANQKLALANQPEIPLRMSFRKAFLSSGNVASFGNMSGRTIAITVNIERPLSGKNRSFDLTIDSNQVKEISEREGWAFVSGDMISISQPDHKSLSIRAP